METMSENMEHQFLALLKRYVTDFPGFKDRHADLSNVAFNRNFGLLIDPPSDWPSLQSVAELIAWNLNKDPKNHGVLVIYPDTSTYDALSKMLTKVPDVKVNYFAWHEMYVAMSRAGSDTEYIRMLRDKIELANLVIFIGVANALPEVVDQVRGYCTSCLILLG